MLMPGTSTLWSVKQRCGSRKGPERGGRIWPLPPGKLNSLCTIPCFKDIDMKSLSSNPNVHPNIKFPWSINNL